MADTPEMGWAWKGPESEEPHGPFRSHADAVSDALSYYEGEDFLAVRYGRAVYPDPTNYMTVSAAQLIDAAETRASDAYRSSDPDRVFDTTGSMLDAQDALNKLLKEWAGKWVVAVDWYFIEELQP